ncbi:DEAD/DEAH box helicase [Bacillus marinisedimentorum]|uniref:DEAD/DEAH box helicase n=1 Tax=Bacillus marinisedimentorum TaxID=1821260 RepID=UPI0008723641|nr:DEAD/DEAH box helicase [Bacillus marinisedimentorum]
MTNDASFTAELKDFLRANWEGSGFSEPTPVQSKAVPVILDGMDVICESPTGTGKTLAYLLPILDKINSESKKTQAVILAPSRELVMQIHEEIQKWKQGTEITSAAFIGGANVKKQLEKLKKHPQIVTGTPGRIQELIKMKKLKMHEVKLIAVDEFDMLASSEHSGSLQAIIKSTLKDRQLVFFSATLPEAAREQAEKLMDDPELIRIRSGQEMPNTTEHLYLPVERRDKVDTLRKLVNDRAVKGLVFANNRETLGEIESKLRYKHVPFEVLDGESSKAERERAIKSFRTGDVSLLLATDVAARGLDVEGITHVFHFDFPSTANQYIHRSGRTGRMGAKGTAVSLVTKREESFVNKMARELGVEFKEQEMHRGRMVDAGRHQGKR